MQSILCYVSLTAKKYVDFETAILLFIQYAVLFLQLLIYVDPGHVLRLLLLINVEYALIGLEMNRVAPRHGHDSPVVRSSLLIEEFNLYLMCLMWGDPFLSAAVECGLAWGLRNMLQIASVGALQPE